MGVVGRCRRCRTGRAGCWTTSTPTRGTLSAPYAMSRHLSLHCPHHTREPTLTADIVLWCRLYRPTPAKTTRHEPTSPDIVGQHWVDGSCVPTLFSVHIRTWQSSRCFGSHTVLACRPMCVKAIREGSDAAGRRWWWWWLVILPHNWTVETKTKIHLESGVQAGSTLRFPLSSAGCSCCHQRCR